MKMEMEMAQPETDAIPYILFERFRSLGHLGHIRYAK